MKKNVSISGIDAGNKLWTQDTKAWTNKYGHLFDNLHFDNSLNNSQKTNLKKQISKNNSQKNKSQQISTNNSPTFGPTQQGTGNAKQLALPHAEIAPALRHQKVQPVRVGGRVFQRRLQPHL